MVIMQKLNRQIRVPDSDIEYAKAKGYVTVGSSDRPSSATSISGQAESVPVGETVSGGNEVLADTDTDNDDATNIDTTPEKKGRKKSDE